MTRHASLNVMLRTAKAHGLAVTAIEATPTGYRLTTTAIETPMSELERAREARRARKANGAPHGIKAAG